MGDIGRGKKARSPGSRPTSTRKTSHTIIFAELELTLLLDGSSDGKLIPELARQGHQKLIEMELASDLGANLQKCSKECLYYRNGYWLSTLTTQFVELQC
jgi:hypothetical protein